MVNNDNAVLLCHNEDWYQTSAGCDILLSAHIMPYTASDGTTYPEEHFLAHTFPGVLPGLYSGVNMHGLAFTINYICPTNTGTSSTVETFLLRHLLSAKNFVEAKAILY